jgi:hypothetical protein
VQAVLMQLAGCHFNKKRQESQPQQNTVRLRQVILMDEA